jgi:predicted alpha/beta hydrolase
MAPPRLFIASQGTMSLEPMIAEVDAAPNAAGATEAPVTAESVAFTAADGYPLGGTLYRRDDGSRPRIVVLFVCGGGIKAHHYRYFCTFLAASGFPTLAFDYRGVGQSKRGSLRELTAGFEDWAEYDTAAALGVLRKRFPSADVASVAHSIGGALVMAAPNSAEISQHVLIGPHTGYHGDFHTASRYAMIALYLLVMPPLSRALGYFPARLFGLPDDLPKQVALQWSGRTRPQLLDTLKHWDRVRAMALNDNAKRARGPALVLSIADDPWTSELAVRRLLFFAPGLSPVRHAIEPRDVGLRKLGHWGFFRRASARHLWPIVTRFLSCEPSSAPPNGSWGRREPGVW